MPKNLASPSLALAALSGLLLASGARAHTPHDATVYTAVDPVGAAVVTGFGRQRVWYGLRSEDGGWSWDAALIEGWASGVRSAAWFEGGAVALATDGGGLLIGDGVGQQVSASGIPEDAILNVVRAAPDGRRGLAGGEALYRSEGGEDWTVVEVLVSDGLGFLGEILDVEWSPTEPDVACLVTAIGQVMRSEDGGETWALLAQLPPSALDLDIDSEGRVYVAAGDAGLLIVDGGAVPLDEAWVGAVEVLADGAVLAAGEEAVWRSDGGDFVLATEGLEVPGEGRGGPPEQGRYYRFAQGPEGEVLLAAWEGLHRSDDGGRTWTQLPLVMPSFHVRVQILEGPGGPWITMPSYGGGGLARVNLDGDWESLSDANLGGYLRGAALSPDYDADGVAWTAERGNLWSTVDGGESWLDHTLDGTLDYVENVAVPRGQGSSIAFAAGYYGELLDLAWTTDGGGTWIRPGLSESAEPRYILDPAISPGFDGEGSMIVAAEGVLLGSRDGGPFSVIQYPEAELLRLTFSDAETLWAATPDGLWRGAAHEPLVQYALGGALVSKVAFSPDGATGFAALGEGIARSVDGGDTWAVLPGSPTAAVVDLDVSPSFSEDGVVAAAGYGGVWASSDAGETWSLASNVLSVDVSHQLWSATGDPEWKVVGDVEGAFLRSAADALVGGASATLDFRGEAVSLSALCGDTQGVVEVSLDGGDYRRIDLGGPAGFEEVYCEEVDPGWHTLTVRAATLPTRIDAARVRVADGLAAPLCQDRPPREERCGCATPLAPTPIWLLPLLLLPLRRRHEADR